MSTRNLYLLEGGGPMLFTPRAKLELENNIFDTSFGGGGEIKLDELTDWMLVDANTIEADPTALGREHTFESTYSDYKADDPSPLLSVYSANADLSFEDTSFDFDDTMEASQFPLVSQMPLNLRLPAQVQFTLTAAEQQRLQAIAMPHRVVSESKILSGRSSPATTSSADSRSPPPVLKATTWKSKKSKSSMDNEEDAPSVLCQSRKQSHNAIEKRYRVNLNDKITCLRQGIPTILARSRRDSKSDNEDKDAGAGDKRMCQKYGKAAVLTRALEYIQHLEGATQNLGDEVKGLETRIGAFERLAMNSSSVVLSNTPDSCGSITSRQTLLSIQDDFKQIKHKSKRVLLSTRTPRRKSGK